MLPKRLCFIIICTQLTTENQQTKKREVDPLICYNSKWPEIKAHQLWLSFGPINVFLKGEGSD